MEREELEKVETLERRERERQESQQQQEEELREAVRASLETGLPEEPTEADPRPTTTIRVRGPDGTSFCRRFLASEPLQVRRYLGPMLLIVLCCQLLSR